MLRERFPKSKVLSHAAVAVGGVAVGYLTQRRRLDRAYQGNLADKFSVLRLKGEVKQAGYDEVTGLPRRWAIENAYKGLEKAWRMRNYTRSGEQAAGPKADKHGLLMIDLDHFKTYNDTYGHSAGDELLQTVGGILSDRLRRRDIVARWGGEEFSALLPRATANDVAVIAEELRASIEETGQIKASIGVAEVDLSRPLEDSINMADQALYAAKEAGRNQVVIYSALKTTTS